MAICLLGRRRFQFRDQDVGACGVGDGVGVDGDDAWSPRQDCFCDVPAGRPIPSLSFETAVPVTRASQSRSVRAGRCRSCVVKRESVVDTAERRSRNLFEATNTDDEGHRSTCDARVEQLRRGERERCHV